MPHTSMNTISLPDNNATRIFSELLQHVGIIINGSRPFDIKVKNPKLYHRVLSEGSIGPGESYMDEWWGCEELDVFLQNFARKTR